MMDALLDTLSQTPLLDMAVAFLLLAGSFFTLVGSIGLIKLEAPMSRLHGPTKASTLGVGSLLLASIIYAFGRGEPSLHEVLVMAFLFVTAPITGNFIAKVHLHRYHKPEDLPALPEGQNWAACAKEEEENRLDRDRV
ncbi:Na+/H+ antiporter subunit G [Sulfitobacter aestuarii]|uniref:Na+/H+ antiporter subunit G n=1 Tax=Sulfitobacter aestuarii TaxID=2161676 RepID=A0ABW5U364_9RHOB